MRNSFTAFGRLSHGSDDLRLNEFLGGEGAVAE